ncbi:hypothetical protein J4Q44_G00232410, partial [Coregonus suidteri]
KNVTSLRATTFFDILLPELFGKLLVIDLLETPAIEALPPLLASHWIDPVLCSRPPKVRPIQDRSKSSQSQDHDCNCVKLQP